MYEVFLWKIYIAHVQTVCTRPLLGGEGPGDEATHDTADLYHT